LGTTTIFSYTDEEDNNSLLLCLGLFVVVVYLVFFFIRIDHGTTIHEIESDNNNNK
jgi:hypothetical protein